jgi:hypothetical protein
MLLTKDNTVAEYSDHIIIATEPVLKNPNFLKMM